MSVNSFGGIVVGIVVYIPSSLIVLIFSYLIAEFCKKIDNKYAVFMPAAATAIDTLIFAILINILFRAVIAIV